MSEAMCGAVQDMVGRRLSGEPLQYVLGTWGFRHLEVRVDGRALIPRPETEQVVSAALAELRTQATRVRRARARRRRPRHRLGCHRAVPGVRNSIAEPAGGVGHRRLAGRARARRGESGPAGAGATRRRRAACGWHGARGSTPCRTGSPARCAWWCRTRPTSRSWSGRRSTPRCATTNRSVRSSRVPAAWRPSRCSSTDRGVGSPPAQASSSSWHPSRPPRWRNAPRSSDTRRPPSSTIWAVGTGSSWRAGRVVRPTSRTSPEPRWRRSRPGRWWRSRPTPSTGWRWTRPGPERPTHCSR